MNARYQFTPALLVGIAYDYTKGDSLPSALPGLQKTGSRYHQFVTGADYSLSKHTDVYLLDVY